MTAGRALTGEEEKQCSASLNGPNTKEHFQCHGIGQALHRTSILDPRPLIIVNPFLMLVDPLCLKHAPSSESASVIRSDSRCRSFGKGPESDSKLVEEPI
jgi:hypothetical protein